MKIILETPRLLLREVEETDVEGFFQMDSDPEVARYVGGVPVQSREQCLEIIQSIQKQYITYGMGRWTVILKETGEFAGWCGLKRIDGEWINGRTGFVDIGYRFQRQHWGKGYATEAAKPTLEYGFFVLGLKEICAFADLGNTASHHVLTKIGLLSGNEFEYEEERCVWFERAYDIK